AADQAERAAHGDQLDGNLCHLRGELLSEVGDCIDLLEAKQHARYLHQRGKVQIRFGCNSSSVQSLPQRGEVGVAQCPDYLAQSADKPWLQLDRQPMVEHHQAWPGLDQQVARMRIGMQITQLQDLLSVYVVEHASHAAGVNPSVE